MKDRTWYAARMSEPLKPFERGEIVYVRRAVFKEPLAVGPVLILFQVNAEKSTRVAESYGKVFNLLPNNANPEPAPPEKNERIEAAYTEYREAHPMAKRVQRKLKENKFKGVA